MQSFNHDDIISKTYTPAKVLSESPPETAFISQFRLDGNSLFFLFYASNRLFGGMRLELIPL